MMFGASMGWIMFSFVNTGFMQKCIELMMIKW